MTEAIECRGLTKDYGANHGVFALDLVVHRGEAFGFVGPNGAGKTTTLRLLMDLVRPDAGRATVLGLDAHRDGLAVKRKVGYLPGELAQFPGMTAGGVLGLLAGLRGGVELGHVEALAQRLQLDLGQKYERLSHGNKQKVHLIQAFMHEPELIILDEPTLGLDPLMQREFRALVKEAVGRGATVLLSSHVLSEVELICDRIGFIREGRLWRVGSLEELRTVRAHRVEALVEGAADVTALERVPGVSEASVSGKRVSCTLRGPVAPLLTWLSSVGVVELDSRELSLEEVFLSEFAPKA
ncbi:MAG: ATP-binding cassette domain-containing protein [Myxococcota bacterium]